MTDFESWWYHEGSAFRPVDEDIEEFSKRMCQIAWSNGAYAAREASAKIADEKGWHVTAADIRKGD